MDVLRHSGKTIVVTGAGRGIGRAVALRLAEEGARVVGFEVNEAGMEETLEMLGDGHVGFIGDVSSGADIHRFVAEQPAADVLVNVAGIADNLLPIGEMSEETWDSVLAINATGPMRLTKVLLPGMIERGSGNVINIASVAAWSGGGAGTAYTASKHALLGMTRSVAFYYGQKGIRCNVVAPGPVVTDLSGSAEPGCDWAWEKIEPLLSRSQQFATAEQIASVVSWLGCEESSIINGALIAADAGWSAA